LCSRARIVWILLESLKKVLINQSLRNLKKLDYSTLIELKKIINEL